MYPEVFNQLLKQMRPFMRQHSFTSKGNNFYKAHEEGNVGIINFQRSRGGEPKFTINVGIFSPKLAEFTFDKVVKPSLGCYQWERRIGDLVPKENPYRQRDEKWLQGRDKWWWYDNTTDAEALFNEISEITTFAIFAINQRMANEQLIDEWSKAEKSSKARAAIEVGEMRADIECDRAYILKNLSILLLASGEKEKLKTTLHELGEYIKNNSEATGLKKYYDKIMKESGFSAEDFNVSENLDPASDERNLLKEDPSTSCSPSKKLKL